MAAFDRILSGIPEMDNEFNNIRLGDNVVWQVSELDEFESFVKPYVNQAIADKRNLIYIRFAKHKPFIENQEGVKIYEVVLSHRFEQFTVDIHNIIEKEGKDAFYVFDCLSDLQIAWSTDLMMSNFFMVTCPYLFVLDTVAYFPIIRGRHSFEAIAKIKDTTQLFLDVYGDDKVKYVYPIKIWKRYSPTMFLPHMYEKETKKFKALTDGFSVSEFYSLMNKSNSSLSELSADSWDRLFELAKIQFSQGILQDETVKTIYKAMMTRDEKIRQLIEQNFTVEDFFEIRSRMIGTGLIGGKACGMLVARKIVENNLPELSEYIESHDSFFIGSDVFYTYVVFNNCWKLRIRQRSKEEYFTASKELGDALKKGTFPDSIKEQFRRMLEYFGQCPIIVRSSSILEDGFGNAFAGKYESIFCVNTGTIEERLNSFIEAVKEVYASTMNPSALEYRARRNLAERDEQMSVLVQRVSGSYFGNFFMPAAAGVGYSQSMYKFLSDMKTEEGMLRIVLGLGTKAVDRTTGDYPRLISLEKPLAQITNDIAERHKYSQHNIDVLDLINREKIEISLDIIKDVLPKYVIDKILEHDTEAEQRLRERGDYRNVYFISCQGLAKNETFILTMKKILDVLQNKYDYPVDVEFTVNLADRDRFVVNILQCRPLQTYVNSKSIEFPTVNPENVYFNIFNSAMGRSRADKIDIVIQVDPKNYYNYPYNNKSEIAHLIGEINRYYNNKNMNILFVAPGRIGTSSPELGVPVTFADISSFCTICEVSYSEVGYLPELSYGSHIFQDLVEADILYAAIFKNDKTLHFNEMIFQYKKNILTDIIPHAQKFKDVVQVYDLSKEKMMLYHDTLEEKTLCTFY